MSSPPANIIMTDTHPSNSSTTSLVASPSVASSDSPPPSFDAIRSSPPPPSFNGDPSQDGEHTHSLAPQSSPSDVDPQIVEALKSKDRLYVLKLGEAMEGLINDRRARVELQPSTSYQRLLVHRCSAYYKLVPETDQVTKSIWVSWSPEGRIPEKRLADLVPPEPTPQPTFKIMRRTQQDRKVKPRSQTGSVTGEEADSSDVEPSEAGSLGGRSSVAGSNKKRMTIEEREAAYQEARSRIFMDFDEKGKDKEKDMSASSSTLSLSSAPTSASGGGSSVGDIDDSVSSLATESELSGPTYSWRDSRRSGNASASSSSRSTRNTYTSNGSSSSRNSRAPSPSFTYASLYEPSPTGPTYDQSQQHTQSGGYPPGPYMYPSYQHPQQPPNAPYPAPYGYYPYPYGHLPPPSQHSSDTSASSEMYPSPPPPPPPPPHVMYGPPYVWSPPPNQSPIHPPPPMQSPQSSNSGQTTVSHPPRQPQQYPAYIPPPHGYGYPMPGYYTPPPGQPMHSMLPPSAPQFFDDTRIMNGSMPGNSNNHGYIGDHAAQQRGNGFNSRNNSNRSNSNGTGKTRGGAPAPRAAWSYGPGIGGHGLQMSSGNSSSSSSVNGETVGPRLNNSMRRTSTTSTGSSGQYRSSSNGDEAASQTSSTSSSSRHTYTSATSSQHPLPARPDWAVGLKPDPTLHATNRHHDNNSRNMSPMSPPRNLNGGGQSRPHQMPMTLQPNDFPPLTSTPEKRTPAAPVGAWTNSASRSLLMTPPAAQGQGNVVHHHQAPGVQNSTMPGMGEFDRPPPKAAELFNPNPNPKGPPKRGGASNAPAYNHSGRPAQQQQVPRGLLPVADVHIVEQLRSMSVSGEVNESVNQPSSSSQPPAGLS
ncbi:r3h domain [Moniliophthora roreri MCA 2997]|uniref:R3h domain n=2 Tax=Moniliophthora roreri TaxID=221103 RepID=V2Z1I4_MONRO|nr:r3h domain [Moniliophthora roreri MCA 2997]